MHAAKLRTPIIIVLKLHQIFFLKKICVKVHKNKYKWFIKPLKLPKLKIKLHLVNVYTIYMA